LVYCLSISLSPSLAHYLYVPLDPCVGERSFQGQANAFVRNCTCSVVVTATNARYPGEAGILAFPFSARMSKWDGKRLQVFFPFSPYHSLSLSPRLPPRSPFSIKSARLVRTLFSFSLSLSLLSSFLRWPQKKIVTCALNENEKEHFFKFNFQLLFLQQKLMPRQLVKRQSAK
jgi:hypothetical protein